MTILPLAPAGRRIQWEPWTAAAFGRSAEERRPVLLLITAGWSAGSAAMLRTTYDDPAVAACVEQHYVPVHVDADLRPDISDRYALDSWPSTLLLTSDGEVLHGVQYLDAEPLRGILERTAALYRDRADDIATRAAAAREGRRREVDTPTASEEPGPELAPSIAAAILDRADQRHGGFSGTPKRLDGDALLFLLRYGVSAGDREAIAHVERTLDAVDASPLMREDGAIFRCAAQPDWSEPSDECDGATQAAGLRVFAEAAATLGNERYAARTRALATYVSATWFAPSSLRVPLAQWTGGNPAQGSVLTDLAAELASACFAAAIALEDPRLAQGALPALERCLLATYRPGRGVAHSAAAEAPRCLSDHVHAVLALLDAREITGELPYAMMAEELGLFATSAFADSGSGALRDRVHAEDDAGRLREPHYPFRVNAFGAVAWARLAAASGDARFAEVAARVLAWATARWRLMGPAAAACGLAALDLIDCRTHS